MVLSIGSVSDRWHVICSAIFVTDIQDGMLLSFRLPDKGKADDGKIDVRQQLIDWDT